MSRRQHRRPISVHQQDDDRITSSSQQPLSSQNTRRPIYRPSPSAPAAASSDDTYVMTTMTEGLRVTSLPPARQHHSHQEDNEDAASSCISSLPSTASGSFRDLNRQVEEMDNREDQVLKMLRKQQELDAREQELEFKEHNVIQEQPLVKNHHPGGSFFKSEVLKIRSPREECSPEDCCCCFYFLYLLFNQDFKPASFVGERNKVVSSVMNKAQNKIISKTSPNKKFPVHSHQDKVLSSSAGPGYSYFRNISTASSIESKGSFLGKSNNDEAREEEPVVEILIDTAFETSIVEGERGEAAHI